MTPSFDSRLADPEKALRPHGDGYRIRVLRVPHGIPDDEEVAWVDAHQECISRVVEVAADGRVAGSWSPGGDNGGGSDEL